MKKRTIGILAVAVSAIAISVFGVYRVTSRPPSIEYLNAHPKAFRFEYRYSQDSFVDAIDNILNEGMKRNEVEEIFVKTAGAVVTRPQGENQPYYTYMKETSSAKKFCPSIRKGRPAWRFTVKYDEKGQITTFTDKDGVARLFYSTWPCF